MTPGAEFPVGPTVIPSKSESGVPGRSDPRGFSQALSPCVDSGPWRLLLDVRSACEDGPPGGGRPLRYVRYEDTINRS